jgi:hypothetical protein
MKASGIGRDRTVGSPLGGITRRLRGDVVPRQESVMVGRVAHAGKKIFYKPVCQPTGHLPMEYRPRHVARLTVITHRDMGDWRPLEPP